MKYCPQCGLEFEDETVFCPTDGSRLQGRSSKPGSRPQQGSSNGPPSGTGMGLGLGPAVLSSQPITPLGSTSLQVPTPPRGVSKPAQGSGAMGGATQKVQRTSALRAAQPGRNAPPVLDTADTVRPPQVNPSGQGSAGELAVDMAHDPSEMTMRHTAISREVPTFDGDMPVAPDGPRDQRDSDAMIDSPTIAMKAPVPMQAQATYDENGERNLIGTVVAGRYKVSRRLGEGGMGVVYQAIDERLEKPVAVKVLRDDFAKRQDVVARFTQEAKSAARIKHENVLDVTDYGQTDDGSFYIAMELLTGTDLADVLQGEGTVAADRGVEIAVQVCRALQAAHQKGIVHRDLKPENVFLIRSDDGREVVKIVDFGIAQMKDISGSAVEGSRKLTRTGMIFGTPEYMSPEQAAGKPIDHRVDVYAVGVILYEMFAGRVPFVGDTFMGVLTQHMFEPPPPLRTINPQVSIAPDLEAVIFKALAKDPNQRYASMQEFSDDLQRFRSGGRTSAGMGPPPSAAVYPGSQAASANSAPVGTASITLMPEPGRVSVTVESELTPRRRSPAVIVLGVLGVMAIGGAIAVWALSGGTPQPQPETPAVAPPVAPPTKAVAPPISPRVPPAANANTPPLPPVAPPAPAPRTLSIRVSADGVTVQGFRFEYVTPSAALPPIEACNESPCVRQVPAGVALRVVGVGGRRPSMAVVTPSTENQTVRVSLVGRGAPNNAHQSPAQGNATPDRRPCVPHADSSGLLVPCFDNPAH